MMKSPPVIVVQLVHIEGPLKGEIQEFGDPIVTIGRHPSSSVCFPKDFTAISRNHAEIVREGNRFRLIDKSTNGTFVNGKQIEETHLKDGDVLVFSEGGPKVSFLTQVMADDAAPEVESTPRETIPPTPKTPPPQAPAPPQTPASVAAGVVPKAEAASPPPPPKPSPQPISTDSAPSPPVSDAVDVQRHQVPLVIQYGPTLQSFKEVPVVLGKNPACEFMVDHPSIQDRHVQFFFHEDQYWVKDLTGQHVILVNGQPIQVQAPLHPDDQIALSPQGPTFRFLGGGRLAEIEAPKPEQQPETGPAVEKHPEQEKPESKGLKGAKAIFDKFLRR